MPFQAAQSMMLAIVKRFRFGDEIEEYIKAMQAPKPQDDGKKEELQAKAQMEREKHDAEMAQKKQEGAQREREMQMKAQLEQEKLANEREMMQMEIALAREEHGMKMQALQAKAQVDQIVNASKIQVTKATAAAKEKQAATMGQGPQ
jgi:hypothetical protein